MYNKARSCNHCFRGKAVLHILGLCLQPFLSIIKCACAVVYGHPWPVLLYHIFPHFLINGTIFEKNGTEHKMCVLTFSTTLV